ncbi:MAG: SEC-C metal-binding domain-containing protein [Desulfovermiculus sp.]
MKIGRNDPCPCGSGKKYKKCCLEKHEVSDLGYRRLSNAQHKLVEKLTEYVIKDVGEKVLYVALGEFFQDDTEDSETLLQVMLEEFSPVFWPWLFHILDFEAPDLDMLELSGLIRPNMTLGEMYLQDKSTELDPLEQELLSAANRVSFSFFEVTSVHPGKGFEALDLLTGQRVMISDLSASQDVERGEILYSQVIEVQGYYMSIGHAQYKFFPRFKPQIMEFGKELEEDFGSVTNEVLMQADPELRDFFLYLQDAMFEQPELRNTDGDPLSLRTLHYDISSPEEAFQALAPLCVHATEEELRGQADLNESGQVHKVHFAWSRQGHALSTGLDNTTLGQISIQGNRMSIEVNSEAREEMIREEIDRRLGSRAVYKVTDIRSADSMMAEGASEPASRAFEEEQEALKNSPEVQQALEEMLTKHWQGWLDTEIPALGGKTPRQAVQTADGREAVQALLRDIEISDQRSNMQVSQQSYVDWARRELGLPDT